VQAVARRLNATAAAIEGGRAFTFTPARDTANMLAAGQNTMPRGCAPGRYSAPNDFAQADAASRLTEMLAVIEHGEPGAGIPYPHAARRAASHERDRSAPSALCRRRPRLPVTFCYQKASGP
jgi:hypothetical protein